VTRRARITSLLVPAERRSLVGMVIVILALHVVGWGVLAGMVAPHSFSLGSGQVFGIGLGLTAYALGMRNQLRFPSFAGAISACSPRRAIG
jgi:high-affinity nickel-transport protein